MQAVHTVSSMTHTIVDCWCRQTTTGISKPLLIINSVWPSNICHAMQYYTVLCRTISYYTVLCHTMPYYTVLCHTMPGALHVTCTEGIQGGIPLSARPISWSPSVLRYSPWWSAALSGRGKGTSASVKVSALGKLPRYSSSYTA